MGKIHEKTTGKITSISGRHKYSVDKVIFKRYTMARIVGTVQLYKSILYISHIVRGKRHLCRD